MAPSRGLNPLLRARYGVALSSVRRSSQLVRAASDASHRTQVYLSRSRDPYLNLSIEHYLLQKTPADAVVLFLYTNRPSIIIGRNQNPWLEVNLALLRDDPLQVDLVRRRSGGGTVFHDEGNVNYSVICPTPIFNRDKHAEMVVRALHKLGVDRAAVNDRHDIVLRESPADARPLKVSGSAYKLTRQRSLHHGTCLLSSPHIHRIGAFLRSPAKPFIKARGVDSVSSPITNVEVPHTAFEQSVLWEFEALYGRGEPVVVGDDAIEVPEVRKGFEELTSPDWIYSQTPQFSFSTYATEDDPRARPPLPGALKDFHASFTARNGSITSAAFGSRGAGQATNGDGAGEDLDLIDTKLHEVESWTALLQNSTAGIFMDRLFRSGDR